MLNAPALDVAIGLVFLYATLALMVTAVNEWIASAFKLRGKTLTEGISQLLDGDKPGPMTDEFYAHPLVKGLSKAGRKPSYVPPKTFALVVKDLASKQQEREAAGAAASAAAGQAATAGQGGAAGASDSHLREQLRTMALGRSATDARSQTDILESWFNDGMERVAGWYKRRIQLVTIAVAVALTMLTNADTFRAAAVLWANPTVREAVVEQARIRAAMPPPREQDTGIQAGTGDLNKPAAETKPRTSAEFVGLTSAAEPGTATGAEITAAEVSALGLFIGWSDVFHHFNGQFCAAAQDRVNEACRIASTPDEALCQALIDELARDRRCVSDGANRLGTRVFPGWALLGNPGILLTLAGRHLAGWLLTIIAVSLGAPFWFDLLTRFTNLRGAGAKPAATT